MNALPVKTPSPQEIIDDLIATFGLRKVVFAMIARFFKRSRPPDASAHPGVDHLNDHLRADIGLPPHEASHGHVNPIVFGQPRM